MQATPFSRAPYSTIDFRNALADITSDIEMLQPLIARFEMTDNLDDEARMLLAMSGLEIKMTNFARNMRSKLT